ncbi:amyloid beta A4 precursor protein-binding family B member 1-interacting protein-like isoform X4 [Amphibalanus amphitrite]|uniref:amyloid beta A4 precursor protein-binding family B member 1-interacting protein-like isoform X4 n=1 Tax=Amphibalanus amphitrite TaxID=1232801 RepID=UPI001C9192C3|nr:amyloid beta A4 precursor protein-binding family B member 1-interacting protein-like isoform X4 [Amphibalanus amphitrite]
MKPLPVGEGVLFAVVGVRRSMEDDSSYNSEAEPDSDTEESSGLEDPEALLQTWLGELDSLNMGLDSATASACSSSSGRPESTSSAEQYSHAPRTDSYRLSMAVLEGSQDVELDAILGELCALETQFDKEIKGKPVIAPGRKPAPGEDGLGPLHPVPPRKPGTMGGGARPKFEVNYSSEVDWSQRHEKGPRTESPDNDSAFSDNLSMLSSESSASSGGSGGSGARTEVSKSSSGVGSAASPTSQADQAARIKAEKIKLALEKIREANVKKLFIKAFMGDGSTKSLLVDEKMSCGHVTRMLADKNHVRMEPRWAITEYLPELLMERVYEDHENLVDNLMQWTRDSKNELRFQERADKYDLFVRPELYLLPSAGGQQAHLDDDGRAQLIEEFFSASGSMIPEIESELWLKTDKKGWKRHHFVLRGSGIYYSPKGKVKTSKDLVCLAKFDVNQVYYGVGWKKKYKAPSDFCFAIKHPQIQVKAPKHTRYLCADDARTLHQWMMAIRVAKHGRQLQENYRQLMDDLAQDDIDRLAHARSFSVASVAPSTGTPTRENGATIEASLAALAEQAERLSDGSSSLGSARSPMRRQDSVISRCSGSSSSKSSENAFDSDHPQGTIKRKPSMAPKLPLTSTTRLLVKADESTDQPDSKPTTPTRQPGRRLTGDAESLNGTLTRRRERQATDTLRSTGSGRSLESRSDSLRSTDSSRSADSRADSVRSADTVRARVEPPPLPPPPTADLDSDSESLPPPPEMSGSMLSLASLPPPPEELMMSSMTSVSSLPPPPSPHELEPPRVTALPPRPPAAPAPPAYAAAMGSPLRESPPPPPPPPAHEPMAPALPPPMPNIEPIYSTGGKRAKKISFADSPVVLEAPAPAPQPIYARGRPPPPPPKRSETTRLSTGPAQLAPPNRLDSPQCSVGPPRDFLRDLQRVMHKKWTVAEKCKVDLKSPHEVLGFRDPFGAMDAGKEQHVGQWLAQHYGGAPDEVGSPTGAAPAQPLYDSPRSALKKRRGDGSDRVRVLMVRMRERTDCRLCCPARISVVVVARVCTIVDCGGGRCTCDSQYVGEVAVAMDVTKALQDVHFICNFVWSHVSGVVGRRA